MYAKTCDGNEVKFETHKRLSEDRSGILSSLERFITTIELPDIRIKINPKGNIKENAPATKSIITKHVIARRF